jgi:hypothetical protein
MRIFPVGERDKSEEWPVDHGVNWGSESERLVTGIQARSEREEN